MTTFVLVAGAGHSAWCWERVQPILEKAGHRVVNIDLLGMGKDRTPLAQATVGAWADQMADVIKKEKEPVVLVGHSRGGIVISEVAERVPERISSLVYLTAILAKDGQTLGDAAKVQPGHQESVLTSTPDGNMIIRKEATGPILYNTTPPEWVKRAEAQIGPEPISSFAARMKLSDARYGRVRRAFIECLQDKTISIAVQRAMQAELPCNPVIAMDTDHSPFFSAPDALAANLITIAKQAA